MAFFLKFALFILKFALHSESEICQVGRQNWKIGHYMFTFSLADIFTLVSAFILQKCVKTWMTMLHAVKMFEMDYIF